MVTNGAWELNFDSAPFCNGSLHLGHVRNYVLGDVRARWLRKQGIDVSYASSYDAFGLPNEIGAVNAGLPHEEYVEDQIQRIAGQLIKLRLSYSAPLKRYCDPSYYRWTQWLFLELWDADLIHHRTQPTPFCTNCDAFLATNQNIDEHCWRCGGKATRKMSTQWYINTSEYWDRLYNSIDELSSWSSRARNLLKSLMSDMSGSSAGELPELSHISSNRSRDWLVSRNRTWGTPIPLVNCKTCGVSPVRASELPVRLACHGGSDDATCSSCGKSSSLVDRTFDCFFDDAWCFFGAARRSEMQENPFIEWFTNPPTWVHFHAGYDTFAYLHVFRFISYFLFDRGYTPRAEPIDFFHGHDVVTSCRKKMSKRNGNAPDLGGLLEKWGTDVVRLSVISNANPGKPMCWSDERLVHGQKLLNTLNRLIECEPSIGSRPVSQSDRERINRMRNQLWRVDQFVEQYRVGAAIDLLYVLTTDTLRLAKTNRQYVAASIRKKLLPYWNIFAPVAFESVVSSTTVDDVIRQSSSGLI